MDNRPLLDLLRVKSTREVAALSGETETFLRVLKASEGIVSPAPSVREFVTPHIQYDRVILTSDWHVPYHDPGMILDVIEYATTHDISTILALGDVIDLPTLSRFDPRDIDSHVGMELSAVGDVMYQFFTAGLQVKWYRGNHELRIFRAMKHQIVMSDLVRLCGAEGYNVRGHEEEDVVLESGGVRWLLTHPQEYSKMPLTVPKKLVAKYHMNVATAHGHHYAYGVEGDYEMLELGGLFDPNKLAYLHRGGATTFPHQQQGFWVIDNGEVRMP